MLASLGINIIYLRGIINRAYDAGEMQELT